MASMAPMAPLTPLAPLTAPSGNTEQVASLNSSARFQRLSRPDARTRADLIKRSCRIEDVVMGQRVLLRVVGDGHHLVGLCPFHREQRASFTVYPDTQSFCCFGCHAAGDVITFICLLRQVAFTEALRILGEQQFGTPAPISLKWAEDPENREPSGISLSPSSPLIQQQAKQIARPSDETSATGDLPSGTKETIEDNEEDTQISLAQALLWITLVLGMQGLARTPGVLTSGRTGHFLCPCASLPARLSSGRPTGLSARWASNAGSDCAPDRIA